MGRSHARLAGAIAAAALLTLPACNKSDTAPDAGASPNAVSSDTTLAAAVAGDKNLSTVSGALKDTGLAQVFDGAAPYTILAPQDAAFDKLGTAGAELQKPEQRAALVAVLRDHIVPGYVTPDDLRAALDRAAGNDVKMKTVGGHVVTFTQDGNVISVAQEDGSTAKLAGEPVLAGNGVALPIDGVLKKVG
jgi:uncharacterized surface protein with fasciclin (FAS1) repeats